MVKWKEALLLKKRLQISQETPNSDWKWDLRMYLLMYNSTPHSTTGVAPSALMFGRVLRDKLPSMPSFDNKLIEEVKDRDLEMKMRGSDYIDRRRRAMPNSISVGDTVVAKRVNKENKLSSNFNPEELVVVQRNGSDATLRSKETGKTFHRNVTHLKPIATEHQIEDKEIPSQTEDVSESGTGQEPTGIPSPFRVDQHMDEQGTATNSKQTVPQQRPHRSYRQPGYLNDYSLATVQDM